jgi:hypothetical protein
METECVGHVNHCQLYSGDHMEPSMRFQALVYHGKLDKNELNIWSCQIVILNILHRWFLLFQGL